MTTNIHALDAKIDRQQGKENLYKRAKKHLTPGLFETYITALLDKGKDDPAIKNLFCLDYLEPHALNQIGRLVDKSKNNVASVLDNTPETDKYLGKIAQLKILLGILDRHEIKGYSSHLDNGGTSGNKFSKFDYKFFQDINTYKVETILFNRIYEMMCTDLFIDIFQDAFPQYSIRGKKTTLYDDTTSGIDIIISGRDPKDGFIQNIGFDLISSVSETSVAGKGGGSQKMCYDFNGSIRKGGMKIDRYIGNANPEVSFMLLNTYLQALATGKKRKKGELLNQYDELREKHPEYHIGLDNSTKSSIYDITINLNKNNNEKIKKRA